jgi:hypothetical protein
MLIYISYNHLSSNYAKKLYNNLQKHGIDAWYADLVAYGDDLDAAINQKRVECDVVIFLMTPQAIASPAVQAELKHLTELGKKIYPFLLEDIVENPYPQLRYVDVRGGKLPPKRFYQQLESLNVHGRLAGDTTTDAPAADVRKKKNK